jgi:phosphoribosylformylglycinamidine synthase
VKHACGRFFAPPELLAALTGRDQIALRYVPGHNPNGSVDDIAGVTNETGNVLGLMPHPEHAVDALTGSADALRLFAAAAAAQAAPARAAA